MATSAAQFPLPLAPEGAVQIGDATFVHTDEHGGQVWLLGRLWWSWQTGDEAGRRLAAVQLAESGIARRIDIAQAFRITPETLWRWRQTYAREGIAGLAPSKPGPKGAWKLTDEVISHIVALHAEGHTQAHIATTAGVSTFSVRQVLRNRATATQPVAPADTGSHDTDEKAGAADGDGEGAPEDLEVVPAPTPRTAERQAARFRQLEQATPVFTQGRQLPLLGAWVSNREVLGLSGRFGKTTCMSSREFRVSVSQEVLLEVDPVQRPARERVAAGSAGTKVFREYDQHQTFLLPPSLMDWLPEEHLARVIDALVEDTLDLTPILSSYVEERGYPPHDPRMMLKLLLYGYATGVCSSRKLERACHQDVAFRFLAGNQTPDYRSIARFRKRHLAVFEELVVQVLAIAKRAGLVKLGRVALDGSKVRANASRRKAMSYERMGPRERQLADELAELRAQAAALVAEAEAVDAAEDDKFGQSRGDELPDELARKESRLATLRQAKQALEAEAAEAAAQQHKAKQVRKARRAAARKAEREGASPDQAQAAADAAQAAVANDPNVAAAAQDAARDATPKPKAQRNFTDPDSRIMKTSDRAFHQCYNAQVVVDEDSQIIVAADLTNQAADCPHLPGLLDQVETNLGSRPDQLLADAGYFSEDNVAHCDDVGVDALIATGRFKHNEPPVPAPRGPIPKNATVKQRMARKLRTKTGRAAYARRKAIVEPVFGQMHTRQNAHRVLLRGLDAARGEYQLHVLCHNILKMFTAGIDLAPTAAT